MATPCTYGSPLTYIPLCYSTRNGTVLNRWLLIAFTLQSSRVILVAFQDHQHWDMWGVHFCKNAYRQSRSGCVTVEAQADGKQGGRYLLCNQQ